LILAHAAALRSTCLSRQVGCVIVRNGQVVATGYNGTPARTRHPEEFNEPCPCQQVASGAQLALKYCAHAEANAVAQSAFRGASTEAAQIYCTNMPCIECTKVLITAGIRTILFEEEYPDLSGLRDAFLQQAGIEVRRVDPEQVRRHLGQLVRRAPYHEQKPEEL
jgi:dCMP deaminase